MAETTGCRPSAKAKKCNHENHQIQEKLVQFLYAQLMPGGAVGARFHPLAELLRRTGRVSFRVRRGGVPAPEASSMRGTFLGRSPPATADPEPCKTPSAGVSPFVGLMCFVVK